MLLGLCSHEHHLDKNAFNILTEYPDVSVQPTFLSVSVGDNAEFHCEAHGLPTPQIRWAVKTRGSQEDNDLYQVCIK